MNDKWDIEIKPHTKLLKINIKEIFQYRDLIGLFVKRYFSIQYKQTILGPLWFIINPLLTTLMFTLVFGKIAGLSTDGVPPFAFYMCSNAIWSYFSTCINQTSNTFTSNAGVFGKVYFPRLTVPIATVVFSLINFAVVFVMFLFVGGWYMFNAGNIHPNMTAFLIPVYILQTALFGLGTGIIISSLTTKYRDLQILVSFGIQLWMYATPVVYMPEQIGGPLHTILMLNPMAPVVCNFRYALLGCGNFEGFYWAISVAVTMIVLLLGIILFNRVEKTFMDTV